MIKTQYIYRVITWQNLSMIECYIFEHTSCAYQMVMKLKPLETTQTLGSSRGPIENRQEPPSMFHLGPLNGERSRFLGRGPPL